MQTRMKLMAALKTWVVIYPSIILFNYFFGEQLNVLPSYQRTFLLTVSLVPWMLFVGMPLVNAILKLVTVKKQRDSSTIQP